MGSEIVDDVQPEQSDEPADENKDLINDGVHLLDEDIFIKSYVASKFFRWLANKMDNFLHFTIYISDNKRQ